MSDQEHYFENLLFAYARSDGSKFIEDLIPNDSNLKYFGPEVKKAIETCAVYIIDCCNWNPKVVGDFLQGNFTAPSSE